jgi:hypothetical protein
MKSAKQNGVWLIASLYRAPPKSDSRAALISWRYALALPVIAGEVCIIDKVYQLFDRYSLRNQNRFKYLKAWTVLNLRIRILIVTGVIAVTSQVCGQVAQHSDTAGNSATSAYPVIEPFESVVEQPIEMEAVTEFDSISSYEPHSYHANIKSEIESGIGQWPTYATYFKAGPSFGLGGYFNNDRRVGFSLQGGIRESFGHCSPWFFDFGGSFQTIGGRDLTTVIDGVIPNNQGGIPDTPVPDAFTSTLRELRRASIQTSIGYYFQPLSGRTYEMLFSWRFGSRWGHAKADFERIPADTNAAGTVPVRSFADTDDFLGIFGGVEWVLTKREFLGGDISFVVDAEVANEWIELEGLQNGVLPTASVLFGVTLRR